LGKASNEFGSFFGEPFVKAGSEAHLSPVQRVPFVDAGEKFSVFHQYILGKKNHELSVMNNCASAKVANRFVVEEGWSSTHQPSPSASFMSLS
ncbi:MAG: hypothetical protein ACK55Z_30430, partial [bacterium]